MLRGGEREGRSGNGGNTLICGDGGCLKGGVHRDGIFKQSMGARNRVGIGLSYRPARLHRLAEFIPWNRFLGFINV